MDSSQNNNEYSEYVRNEMKKTRFATINDLEEGKMEEYKTKFFEANVDILSKHLGYVDKAVLDQTLFGRVVNPVNAVAADSYVTWVYSDLRYGMKNLFVPIDFYTLTETILSLNCQVQGIFRVRNSIDTVKQCVDILEQETRERTRFEVIRNKLAESFNVIDLTTAFKEVIRSYKHTIIPQGFLSLVLRISQIEDDAERIVVYHYFYISLPKFNRHLLEATIYFLYLIHNISTNNGKNTEYNMNMEGISTVMMPNLLLKNNDDADLQTVPLLVDFTKKFIIDFVEIAKVRIKDV